MDTPLSVVPFRIPKISVLIPGITVLCFLVSIFSFTPADAHFGMVYPSTNQVDQEHPQVNVTLTFLHPFEKSGMDLDSPQKAYISKNGENQDLKGLLTETSFLGKKAWTLSYKPDHPGVYWFAMEPAPYWEPAENLFIIHYTKTAVSAFGGDQGWDIPIGMKTEIVPLMRPFGNYAGNTFIGKLLVKGKPFAGADVEIEHYNTENWVAPTDMHVTQVVKTDNNGSFSFTCPLPGWWGFSALTEADFTMNGPDGKEKSVELGAVIWVYFDPNPFLGN